MDEAEYRKLITVEDAHWYFKALHALAGAALDVWLQGRRAPSRILDAGCGTGGLIRRLRPAHPRWEWTGVDVSALACELARQADPGGNYREGRLEALPFADGSFDAAVCADVLYHVADDRAALRELRRILAPGGVLVVNVPAHPWLWSYHDRAVGGVRRYTDRELREKLGAAGFDVQRMTHWNSLLLPAIAVRRKLLPPPAEGSDVAPASPVQTALGAGASALERAAIGAGLDFPFGSSLFAVANAA